MPDGVRNGIDKSADTNFLNEDEEEEEGDERNGGGNLTLSALPPISSPSSENDQLTSGGRKSRNKNKAALLPLSPLSLPLPHPHPHPPQNSLNFFDLLKTGAMVGEKLEKNGNSGQSPPPNANTNRLRLSSGPRDSDYVILVLSQKQREDDEVNMLIDRLRENGVSCLFMKNGATNNTAVPCAKSPTPVMTPVPLTPHPHEEGQGQQVTQSRSGSRSPSRPLIKSPIFHNPSPNSLEKVQSPNSQPLNGKNCSCPQVKCNGVCFGGRTVRQISSSCSSDYPFSAVIRNDDNISSNGDYVFKSSTKQNLTESTAAGITTKSSCPPMILRLPIPSLNINPPVKPSAAAALSIPEVLSQSQSSPLVEAVLEGLPDPDSKLGNKSPNTSVDHSTNKKKRKRRRKYPYMVRKPVKKRKLPVVREEVDQLLLVPSDTERSDHQDDLSPETTTTTFTNQPPSPSPSLVPQPQSLKKPIRVQKSKSKTKQGRGRSKKSVKVKFPIAAASSSNRKSKSKRSNGSSGKSPKSRLQSPPSSSSSPLLHSPHSSSDDPYVFIPDDLGDLEPPPIKLFSPKSGRKNGLCSPNNGSNNGLVVGVPTFSPTGCITANLLTVPTWPPKSRKLSPSPTRITVPIVEELPLLKTPSKVETRPLTPTPIQEEPNPVDIAEEKVESAEELNSEVKKKVKRKRKNEVCQLLTWAISPRPSTPRSTLSTAFLPKDTKDNVVKDKDKPVEVGLPDPIIPEIEIQSSTATVVDPPSVGNTKIEADTENSTEILVTDDMTKIREKLAPCPEEPTSVTETPLISSEEDQKLIEQVQLLEPTATPSELLSKSEKPDLLSTEITLSPSSSPLPTVQTHPTSTRVMKEEKVVKRKRKARSALYYKGKKSKLQNYKKNSVLVEPISSFVEEKVGEIDQENGNESKIEGESELADTPDNLSTLDKNDIDSKLNVSGTPDHSPVPVPLETKSLSEEKVEISNTSAEEQNPVMNKETETTFSSLPSKPSNELSSKPLTSKTSPPSSSPKPSPIEEVFKIPAIPERDPLPSTSTSATGASPTPSIPNSFLDAMQLRRPSFYALIAGNVRNNMENFLDGRPPTPTPSDGAGQGGSNQKSKRRKKPRPRNGFLLHHGDNFPEDPEAPYKLHLATQIILKLNKRRSKFKPKEDKGKSLLSYLKLVPKRVSRTSKQNPAPVTPVPTSGEESSSTNSTLDKASKTEDQITSVFSGEWVQPRNFVCNICGQVETDFWDMVHHKGEIHPGIVVTHVELPDLPPVGFRGPPTIPSSSSGVTTPPPCTKCGANFSTYPDLHLHIFECAGNTTWLNELKEEEAQPQRKKKSKRKRGFNRFKRRLSNTPKKANPKLKTESSPQKRRTIEVFKCEFCTREFKTEGWLKNHLTTHSLPISIPLDKLKQSLPPRASNISMGRRSVVQNLLANGNFKNVT